MNGVSAGDGKGLPGMEAVFVMGMRWHCLYPNRTIGHLSSTSVPKVGPL